MVLAEKGRSLQSIEITGFMLAERVGFEPTCPCGQLDFEGRERAKTLYISAYVLVIYTL